LDNAGRAVVAGNSYPFGVYWSYSRFAIARFILGPRLAPDLSAIGPQ